MKEIGELIQTQFRGSSSAICIPVIFSLLASPFFVQVNLESSIASASKIVGSLVQRVFTILLSKSEGPKDRGLR